MTDDLKRKTEAAARRLGDILNLGALNAAMGIGYEAGLFEALARLGRPETPAVIAAEAGLDERYVREWLGAMLAGGVVEVGPGGGEDDRYRLLPEYVPLLTKSGEGGNMGVYMQEIPLLCRCALHEVGEGMRSGAGIPYSRYPRFYEFMEELADAKHEQTLIQTFLPSVDGGKLVERLREGIRVCDLGCGSGTAVTLMARAYPRSEFLGVDISGSCVETASRRAEAERLDNLRFEVRDAAAPVQEPGSFDYITAFDSIHDQTRPLEALKTVREMLRPGGLFSMIDIRASSSSVENRDHPMGAFLYTVSLMHCMPVGLVDGGTGLGMMWGEEKALTMLREAGFSEAEALPIPQDSFNTHYLCRK